KFEGCYHGHTDALLVKAGSGLAGVAASDSAGVSAGAVGETLVAPLDDEEAARRLFAEYGAEIAAVILEPLPANYGLLTQRREFLDEIFWLARANGSLVIFDEVISGFRVALGGMAEVLGLRPDLVTYGKVIGGGFPVGCYGGRRDLLDMVAPSGPVYQAGTLSANPVGMRAGLATLRKIERVDAYARLEKTAGRFCDELNAGMRRRGLPSEVARFGSIFWIHSLSEQPIRRVDQIPADQGPRFARLFHAALRRGVYLAPSGYEVGFLSLAHTDDLLARAIDALLEAASEAGGVAA
ncbi:MAG: aminotransferase class III-fold pyridoxal phosphate-dependent enzyme, partial [Blastocatellia bacterium]